MAGLTVISTRKEAAAKPGFRRSGIRNEGITANGPVLSPATGEVPQRIAIVQGNPRPAGDHLTKTEGLEVVPVTPLSEAAKEQFLPEASGIRNLEICRRQFENLFSSMRHARSAKEYLLI